MKISFTFVVMKNWQYFLMVILCVLGFHALNQNPLDLTYRNPSSTHKKPSKKVMPDMGDSSRTTRETATKNPTKKTIDTQEHLITDTLTDGEISYLDDVLTILPKDFLKNNETKKKGLIFIVIILLMLILTVVLTSSKDISNKIMKAFINDNYLNLLLREQRSTIKTDYIFLYIFFFVNLGLFLFLSIDKLQLTEMHLTLFICILFISVVYITKNLIISYIGKIFQVKKETSQYNFTIIIFNLFLSFFLLPINLFAAFAPEGIAKGAIYIGLAIILLLYIHRQLRGIFIVSNYIISHKFHFLLYLCTIEIAPVLIAVKFFTELMT